MTAPKARATSSPSSVMGIPSDGKPRDKGTPSASESYLRMYEMALDKWIKDDETPDDIFDRLSYYCRAQATRTARDGDVVGRALAEWKINREQAINAPGLGMFAGPSNLERAFVKLLDQRFAYEFIIDKLLSPRLQELSGSITDVEEAIGAAMRDHRSELGQIGSIGSALTRGNRKEARRRFIRSEWRSLADQCIPVQRRADRLYAIIQELAANRKDFPESRVRARLVTLETIKDDIKALALF